VILKKKEWEMRQEIVLCDHCGKNLTNANFVISLKTIHLVLHVEDPSVDFQFDAHINKFLPIDACSWEHFALAVERIAYQEATASVNERKEHFKKLVASKSTLENANDT
jgi:hypothetical protein